MSPRSPIFKETWPYWYVLVFAFLILQIVLLLVNNSIYFWNFFGWIILLGTIQQMGLVVAEARGSQRISKAI